MLPVPVHDDHDTGGFFAAATEGRLAVCVCSACGEVLHLPRPYCSACGAGEPVWREVAPTGTVYSWTVVEHPVMRAFEVPYTIVLVELDELPGVRLVGHLDGAHDFEPGAPMRARFDDVRDGVVVPQWGPAPPPPEPN
jgi:uncharacterized OB-fold protein